MRDLDPKEVAWSLFIMAGVGLIAGWAAGCLVFAFIGWW